MGTKRQRQSSLAQDVLLSAPLLTPIEVAARPVFKSVS
jgi:hypothetical protein